MIHETPRGGSRVFVSHCSFQFSKGVLLRLRGGRKWSSAAIPVFFLLVEEDLETSRPSTRNFPSHTFSAEEGIAVFFVTLGRLPYLHGGVAITFFLVEGASFSFSPCLEKVLRVAVIGNSPVLARAPAARGLNCSIFFLRNEGSDSPFVISLANLVLHVDL